MDKKLKSHVLENDDNIAIASHSSQHTCITTSTKRKIAIIGPQNDHAQMIRQLAKFNAENTGQEIVHTANNSSDVKSILQKHYAAEKINCLLDTCKSTKPFIITNPYSDLATTWQHDTGIKKTS